MDYKNVKQALYAFRFNQLNIQLGRININTGEETDLGKPFSRSQGGTYVGKLDNDQSGVSVRVRNDKIEIGLKEVKEKDGGSKIQPRHFQIKVALHEEQKVAIGSPDEMIKKGLSGIKKNSE